MNLGAPGNVPAVQLPTASSQAVALTLLRRASDLQAQLARQLVAALPAAAPAAPTTTGSDGGIDTYA